MTSTYVTDLRHFLDESGEIVMKMPEEARQMASFLALVVDEASHNLSPEAEELGIRCRSTGCTGQILAFADADEEIIWFCPNCGHNGVIRNWRRTKWDQSSK